MNLDVKFRDENGDIIVEGKLHNNELSYLVTFAVNNLMAAGVIFNNEQGSDTVKMKWPVKKEEMN